MHKFTTNVVFHLYVLRLTSWIGSNPLAEGLNCVSPSKWNAYEGFNLEHCRQPIPLTGEDGREGNNGRHKGRQAGRDVGFPLVERKGGSHNEWWGSFSTQTPPSCCLFSHLQPLTLCRHAAAFSLLISSIFHRFLQGLSGSREHPPHLYQTQLLFMDVCVYIYIYRNVEDPSWKTFKYRSTEIWRSLNICQRCN